MTALAIASVLMVVGVWAAITLSERNREIDDHIRRFLDDIDGEKW